MWELAANAGLADSQFNLGLMYYLGKGVKLDYSKAAGFFLKAAEQGHGQAQYSIAVMNAFGQGMEKNQTEALKWFKESAAQGVPQAQFNLGVFYENGFGTEKNLETARQWYSRAADQGLVEAREKLAALEREKLKETREKNVTHPDPSTLSKIEDEPLDRQQNIAVKPKDPAEPDQTADSALSQTGNPDSRQADWVLQQNPDNYTLQLSSLLSETEAVKFISTHGLKSGAAYLKVVINGTTRYTVIYGVYNTYEQAQRAIKYLSDKLQRDKPWVRNFGQLQKMLKQNQ
jgi:FOG: TPR repeat, SEL1 subfamily